MKYENSGCKQTRSPRPRALAAGVSAPVLIAALLSLGPIALWAGPARADESTAMTDTDERAGTLQEIVVTARKREESLQIAPVSVSATSGATLEQAQITRIDEIAQFAPGLNIAPSPGGVDTLNIVMRGISDPDPILTNDSPVAVYVDGVYLGRTAGALVDLVDIDHIEVLRGPQGTLFGRNTTGGAVSIFTQKPAQKFGIKEDVGYASNNEIHSTTTLDTGTLADTGLSARLTYRHHQMDGYQRNTLTDWANSPGADNTDEFVGTLHWEPVDAFTADYKFDAMGKSLTPVPIQVAEATPALLTYFGNSPNVGGAPFLPNGLSAARLSQYSSFNHEQSHDSIVGHSLTLNYDVNDALAIKSISAYRSVVIRNSTDIGNSGQMKGYTSPCPPYLGIPGCSVPESVQNVYLYYSPYDHERQHQISEELQFGGHAHDLNYVLGLYYFNEHVAEVSPTLFNIPLSSAAIGFPNIAPFNTQALTSTSMLDYAGISSSKAAFSQVSWSPTKFFDNKLELTGGARYTKDEKGLDQNDSNGDRDLHHEFRNTSLSGSLKYQWTGDVMTYFRFSEGYKAGGYSARSIVNGLGPNDAYLPEKAKSFELGVKAEFLDRHVRLNADIYRTDYDDLQVPRTVSLPGDPAATDITNAGNALFRGGEIELTVLPYTGWQLNASLGYVDPQYKQFLTSVGPNNQLFNVAGLIPFGNTSKVTVSSSAQYSFAPMPVGDLTLRADLAYRGPAYEGVGDFALNAAGQPVRYTVPGLSYITDVTHAPGYSDLGAQIILDNVPLGLGGEWMIKVYGKDLLNRYQQLSSIDFTGLGFITNSWGRGRVVGVDLAAKF
jgi:iron complex outermembrane receptor protein